MKAKIEIIDGPNMSQQSANILALYLLGAYFSRIWAARNSHNFGLLEAKHPARNAELSYEEVRKWDRQLLVAIIVIIICTVLAISVAAVWVVWILLIPIIIINLHKTLKTCPSSVVQKLGAEWGLTRQVATSCGMVECITMVLMFGDQETTNHVREGLYFDKHVKTTISEALRIELQRCQCIRCNYPETDQLGSLLTELGLTRDKPKYDDKTTQYSAA